MAPKATSKARKTPPPGFGEARYTKVQPSEAPAFVASSRIAVICVGTPPRSIDFVLEYVRVWDAAGAAAWIDAEDVDRIAPNSRAGKAWGSLMASSWTGGTVRHGYYLFVDGRLRAYDPGLVDFDQDQLSLGAGLWIGLFSLLAESRGGLRVAVAAATFQAAQRVIAAFTPIVQQALGQAPPSGEAPRGAGARTRTRSRGRKAPPPSLPADDLAQAFRVLDLPATATYEQVKAAKRALARRWHPDRHQKDPNKLQEAEARTKSILTAYSLICAAKGWK